MSTQTADITSGKLRVFRPDIEGLRAVAVLLVLFGHVTNWVPGGFVGVDVFFVISGFLITRLLVSEHTREGRISFGGFYARRARRILPAATVVIVATLIGCWLWGPSTQRQNYSYDAMWSALSGVNYRLAIDGVNYFGNTTPSPFQQFWSLAVEEQFYLFWPLLLVLAWRIGSRNGKKASALGLCLGLVTVVSLALSVAISYTFQPWAYFGLPTRAWELAIGGIIAIASPYLSRSLPNAAATLMSWLGLGAILVSAGMFSEHMVFPGFTAILPVTGAAMIIAGGCAAPRFGAELVLGNAAPRFIGKISYSLYLWHWPILIMAPWTFGSTTPNLVDQIVVIVLSFVLAYFSYYLVETPFREQGNKFTATTKRSLRFGGVTIAATTIAALILGLASAPAGLPQKPSDNFVATTVVDKVAEGASLRTLPDGIEGALSSVPNDKPEGCSVRIADVEPTSCIIGSPSATTTGVLMGDSHAWQWIKAFDLLGKRENFRVIVFAKDACTPEGISYKLSKLNRTYTECDTWREKMLTEVGNLRPSFIVFSSLVREGASSQVMKEFILRLRSMGPGKTPVAFIDDTPKPAINIPDCLSQRSVQECSVPRDKAVYSAALRAERRAGAKSAGAMVIDPTRWFCTELVCPPIIDRIVVYPDDNHMSSSYSGRLAYDLGKTLRPILS